MSLEGTEYDKKSLRVLTKANPNWDALACDCVAFANARGGRLHIGIEDDDKLPPAMQVVDDELIEQLRKRIPQRTINVSIVVQKSTAENGGQFIEVQVLRIAHAIASTSDGRYFLRIADETKPLLPDDLQRLLNDNAAYVWEEQTRMQVPRSDVDKQKLADFLQHIRDSERVTQFIKAKSDDDILEYYLFAKEHHLTNLGVLWIGTRQHRATLQYAPVIQFIKYDDAGNKVNKIIWDDFSKNPMELIESVMDQVPDWRESYELPDGLFRKSIPHFDEVVIRELLANALVHRPYTTRGDIFLNLYPDRLEVHNPGLLPLGVTPRNILHVSIKRNELMAKVFFDLKLMEREGSGYDRMYEVLLNSGRPAPKVEEGNDRVAVTIYRKVFKPEIVDFLHQAEQTFQLSQRERITLGLIAQHEMLTLIQLSDHLKLGDTSKAREWLGRLMDFDIVKHKGRTKGTGYFVNPEHLRNFAFKGQTTLRRIEPHRLRELILKDLEVYKIASISEIHARIGKEIPQRNLRSELAKLVESNVIGKKGERKGTRYLLTK